MAASGDIEAALAAQRKRALLAKMPSWLDRESCSVKRKNDKNFNVSFFCPCQPQRVPMTIYTGVLKDEGDIAIRLAEKVQDRHDCHNHTHEAPEKPPATPTTREQQLSNEVKSIKRKLAVAQSDQRALDQKVAKAAVVQAQFTEIKRQYRGKGPWDGFGGM